MEPGRVIVIGASAGGVEALLKVVEALPHDLDASVLVVIHTSPTAKSVLTQLVNRLQRLPATHPVDGQTIQNGRIYIAPQDSHMMIGEDGHIHITRGPKENSSRPAIDPLFRSAAAYFGSGAIAVLLSGNLADGTAGIEEIKNNGGVTIVQNPDEALFRSMPENAIEHAHIDHVLNLADIGPLLGKLCQPGAIQHTRDKNVKSTGNTAKVAVAIEEMTSDAGATKKLGKISDIGCPDCGGVLWNTSGDSEKLKFRCRVGHAYTLDNLLEEQAGTLERAIWTAIRALREKAELTARVAERMRTRKSSNFLSAERFERESARAYRESELLLGLVRNSQLGGSELSAPEPLMDTCSEDELNSPR